jgi:hypothetical protein
MAGLICYHVYKIINKEICTNCNQPTHETNWAEVNLKHKEWIESGQATPQGWSSI